MSFHVTPSLILTSLRYRRVFSWYAAVATRALLSLIWELVPTVVCPGETLSSTHFERRAGGKGANQASAVAKAGGHVKLVGAVGQDGEHLVRGLEAIGVDVKDVVVDSAVQQTSCMNRQDGQLMRGAN